MFLKMPPKTTGRLLSRSQGGVLALTTNKKVICRNIFNLLTYHYDAMISCLKFVHNKLGERQMTRYRQRGTM